MAKTVSFTKRTLIGKANTTMVVATAVAAFVVIFSLVATKALIGQAGYQSRVIDAKKDALTQLKADLSARDSLVNSYKAFVGSTQNVLGGNPAGVGERDGDNAKIILDALPSKYDFPQLTSSLEKLVIGQRLQFKGITGTDDQIRQQVNASSSTPEPVPMPFQMQVSGSYQADQTLVAVMERSIRPFQIQKIDLTGNQAAMIMVVDAQSYFQPQKSLDIKTEVVQ